MSENELTTVHGTPVLVMPQDGPPLDTIEAATEVVGDAAWGPAEMVAMPAARLTDDFFELKTGMAGEVTQKFVNYRLRLAIVGDIESRVAESTSLRAWVTESNRGRQLWFVPTLDALAERLQP
ncbi:DUF4180 domain-containing protein [Aeromicrobium sp. NPDC092404]|uniref:DUF4180 domain-containing protein n=1 Tax=Aeromicrobium sp. NPDC092404 TaxID=3154976 RepID=UPI003448EA27